jgi:tRNA G18 (ribose-2'-O)-methylase SpoU
MPATGGTTTSTDVRTTITSRNARFQQWHALLKPGITGKAVRASTGSLFAVPVVRVGSATDVVGWARRRGARIVGTDESAAVGIDRHDFTGPTLVVVGNETAGMSVAWRQACDVIVRIPIGGSASSLNAAGAATVLLYEAARQRGFTVPGGTVPDR